METKTINKNDRESIRSHIAQALRRKSFRIEARELDSNDPAMSIYPHHCLPVGVKADDRSGWEYLHRVKIPTACDVWIDCQVAWAEDQWSDPEPMDWFTATFSEGRLVSIKGHGQ